MLKLWEMKNWHFLAPLLFLGFFIFFNPKIEKKEKKEKNPKRKINSTSNNSTNSKSCPIKIKQKSSMTLQI